MQRRWTIILLVFSAGCQQQMARQPAYRPLQESSLFPNGMASRPLVAGTIDRDFQISSGKKEVDILGWERAASMVGKLPSNPLGAAAATAGWSLYVDDFPMPVTSAVFARGQQRFNIYCSVCHDQTGSGKGMIVQRGFTPPPNLNTDLSRGFKLKGVEVKLRDVPIGYLYEVVTKGHGAMPDYATQLPPSDRWAVIAYVRALQFSQNATAADVSDPQARKQLIEARGDQK